MRGLRLLLGHGGVPSISVEKAAGAGLPEYGVDDLQELVGSEAPGIYDWDASHYAMRLGLAVFRAHRALRLLYVSLTAAVAIVYVLVVAGVGATLDVRGAGWLPWIATAVVAVAVQPLREALQGAVNRLTFGAWQEPQAGVAMTSVVPFWCSVVFTVVAL